MLGLSNKKKILFICCGFLTLFFLLKASFVYALEVDYPSFPGIPSISEGATLPDFVEYIFKVSVMTGGILSLLFLIVGGVRYLFSIGNPERMVSAKQQISGAFFGLLILLSSYLLLHTINPRLTILELKPLEKIEEADIPDIPLLPTEELRSSIYTEIPLGKIIEEKILETEETMSEEKKEEAKKQNKEEEKEEEKSRMDRIKEIAENSLTLAEKIIKKEKETEELTGQAEELKKAADKCACDQSEPCCENPNPGPGCTDNLCRTKPGCTCDPCEKVRDEIQKIEKENLKVMYLGIEIEQEDKEGNKKQVKTSIREEQKKAAEEIRLIKEEITKLERSEIFMFQCGLGMLTNLSDFLDTKNVYLQRGWYFDIANFWRNIRVKDDWATLYCPVSGTLWEGKYSYSSETTEAEEFISSVGFSDPQKPIPCTIEVPVGEIVDRTKRVAYKLIERLEKLIDLNEQLTKAVNELHTLVSQCSSAGPSTDPYRPGCFSICYKTLFSCIKYCSGEPCPKQAIEDKIKEITDIVEGIPNKPAENEEKKEKEGIRDVVEAKKKTEEEAIEDDERREQVGIKPIIDETVPEIIKDNINIFRKRIKSCVTSTRGINTLLDCRNAANTIDPSGRLIRGEYCSYEEDYFQDCLSQCYLEKGHPKEGEEDKKEENGENEEKEYNYEICLEKCLKKKSEELDDENIVDSHHIMNYYCCTAP